MQYFTFYSCFFLQISLVFSRYSIHYSSPEGESPLVLSTDNTKRIFTNTPNADHVADIYARLSGQPPILREDHLSLPTLDIFSKQSKQPILLEVRGGSIPEGVTTVYHGHSLENNMMGPTASEVASTLQTHHINIETHLIEGNQEDVTNFLRSRSNQPVIILHQDNMPLPDLSRRLTTSYATNYTSGPTEEQISGYQIAMWTGIGMVLLLTTGVCMITTMEVIPDSLLYAKFQSSRTGKND